MSDYQALYDDGGAVTLVASADVFGSSPVTTLGAQAGDASTAVAGVCGPDTKAGGRFKTYRVGIHRGTASGVIVNGDPLCTAVAAAAGQPARLRKWVAGTDPVAARIGRAWSNAADGATVTYALLGV